MLSHNYYLFLLVHTLFLVFTRIPAIFINTLLMNQTGDVNSTLFYNGAIFAAVRDDVRLGADHAQDGMPCDGHCRNHWL